MLERVVSYFASYYVSLGRVVFFVYVDCNLLIFCRTAHKVDLVGSFPRIEQRGNNSARQHMFCTVQGRSAFSQTRRDKLYEGAGESLYTHVGTRTIRRYWLAGISCNECIYWVFL